MAVMKELERALKGSPPAKASRAAALRLAERAAAEGLVDVAYALVDSPVGPLVAATTPRGLVEISYDADELDTVLDTLSRRLSPRVLEAPTRLDAVRRELEEYFEGKRTEFDLPLDWSLTKGFFQRVLRATARVPYGEVSTYRAMAAKAGNERAVRAAGNALGSNPIPIVVPCHRILRTGGGLGGYGGGVEVKEFLLKLEGALD
jgi:methylated-DNA-[protein]-cysteine S-methyltransferase